MHIEKIAQMGIELLEEAILEILMEEKQIRGNIFLTKSSIRRRLGMPDDYSLIEAIIWPLAEKYSLEYDQYKHPPYSHHKWRLSDEEYQKRLGI